jgi:LysW-gamma-L-lysine carboxypeptidase
VTDPSGRAASRDRAESLLRGALEIYSPSGDEREIADYFVSAMTERGMRAEIDDAGSAVARVGRGDLQVVMLGHIDTVPGHIEVRSDTEGRLYGRGAVDAKGPFCSFIESATDLDDDLLDRMAITIVGAVEEEVSSSKGAHHALPGLAPDHVIIGEPSGWDGITIGYKGRLGLVFRCAKGMAHRAGQDASAADQAFRFWQRLETFRAEFNLGRSIFEGLDATITRAETGTDPMLDAATLAVDLRLPVAFSVTTLQDLLRDEAESRGGTVEFSDVVDAVRSEKNTPLVRAFLRAIRAEEGRPRFKLKTGTSDMNVSAGYHSDVPVVAYGPGDSSLDHTPREHIQIGEYHKAIAVLRNVLRVLAG